jgi:hypothetical protein
MVLEAGGVTVHFGWGWGGFFVGMAVAVASRVVGGRVCGDVVGMDGVVMNLREGTEAWDDAVAMANQAVDGLCVLQRGRHCEGHRGPGVKMGLCVVSLLTSGGK